MAAAAATTGIHGAHHIAAMLGMSATCRRHVAVTRKCRRFFATRRPYMSRHSQHVTTFCDMSRHDRKSAVSEDMSCRDIPNIALQMKQASLVSCSLPIRQGWIVHSSLCLVSDSLFICHWLIIRFLWPHGFLQQLKWANLSSCHKQYTMM